MMPYWTLRRITVDDRDGAVFELPEGAVVLGSENYMAMSAGRANPRRAISYMVPGNKPAVLQGRKVVA